MFKKIKIWKNNFKVWREWCKVSDYSMWYKLLVLLKWRTSVSFQFFKASYVMQEFLHDISETFRSLKVYDSSADLFKEEITDEKDD